MEQKLSNKEKLILWNQYEILKNLDTDKAEKYESCQKALEYGIEYVYDPSYKLADKLTEPKPKLMDPIPTSVLEKVKEILDMYCSLYGSFEALEYNFRIEHNEKLGIILEQCMFRGFNSQDVGENGYYLCAEWLIKYTMNYPAFKNCELESQQSMLYEYEQMLKRYYEYVKYEERENYVRNLSAEQIKYIIGIK